MDQLAVFHRKYFLGLVRRSAWMYALSKEDADDVVQEAFLLAATKLRPDGNPKAWLKKVVDQIGLNLVRTSRRRAEIAAKWGLGVEYRRDTEESAAQDEEE